MMSICCRGLWYLPFFPTTTNACLRRWGGGAKSGHGWGCVPIFGHCWPLVVIFVHFQPLFWLLGIVLVILAFLANCFAISDLFFGNFLFIFFCHSGHVGQLLAICGVCWSTFGQTLTIFSPVLQSCTHTSFFDMAILAIWYPWKAYRFICTIFGLLAILWWSSQQNYYQKQKYLKKAKKSTKSRKLIHTFFPCLTNQHPRRWLLTRGGRLTSLVVGHGKGRGWPQSLQIWFCGGEQGGIRWRRKTIFLDSLRGNGEGIFWRKMAQGVENMSNTAKIMWNSARCKQFMAAASQCRNHLLPSPGRKKLGGKVRCHKKRQKWFFGFFCFPEHHQKYLFCQILQKIMLSGGEAFGSFSGGGWILNINSLTSKKLPLQLSFRAWYLFWWIFDGNFWFPESRYKNCSILFLYFFKRSVLHFRRWAYDAPNLLLWVTYVLEIGANGQKLFHNICLLNLVVQQWKWNLRKQNSDGWL